MCLLSAQSESASQAAVSTLLQGSEPAANTTVLTATWPLFLSPAPFPLSPDAVDPVSFLIGNGSALQYADAGSWVLNSGASGIFRVQYPSSHLNELIQTLGNLDVGTGDSYTDEDITSLVDAAALVSHSGLGMQLAWQERHLLHIYWPGRINLAT